MASLLNLFQSSENPFFVSAFTLANNKAYVAVAITAVTVVVAAGVVVTAVNCMQSKHARTKATEKKQQKNSGSHGTQCRNKAQLKCFWFLLFVVLGVFFSFSSETGNSSLFGKRFYFMYFQPFVIPACTCSLFIPAGF